MKDKGLADVGKSANFGCTKIFLHNSFPFLSFPCQAFHICFSQTLLSVLFSQSQWLTFYRSFSISLPLKNRMESEVEGGEHVSHSVNAITFGCQILSDNIHSSHSHFLCTHTNTKTYTHTHMCLCRRNYFLLSLFVSHFMYCWCHKHLPNSQATFIYHLQ